MYQGAIPIEVVNILKTSRDCMQSLGANLSKLKLMDSTLIVKLADNQREVKITSF
jgi:hypothetical protein